MNMPLLSRCFGTAEALHWLPLHRALGPAGVCQIGAWRATYRDRGLPFGTDRATVEALRVLTGAGMLTTAGLTQAKTWKLTTAGVMSAMTALGLDPAESRELLQAIADAEVGSQFTLPGMGRPLVMGWQLVAGAGEWLKDASANDATWRAYQDALSGVSVRLTPLLVLGWAHLYTDACGRLWGATVTPEGRDVLTDWPVAPAVDADMEACFTAWDAGYEAGMGYATRPPPPAFSNVVTRCLPASQWC